MNSTKQRKHSELLKTMTESDEANYQKRIYIYIWDYTQESYLYYLQNKLSLLICTQFIA